MPAVIAHAALLLTLAGGTALVLAALGAAPARLLWGRQAGWPAAAPALGFAVFAVAASWLTLWAPMRAAVWPLLFMAALSLGWTLRQEVKAGVAPQFSLRRWRLWPAAATLVPAMTAAALLMALAPALGRPNLIAAGPNWDVEIYLPLAAALTEAPNGFSLDHAAGLPFDGLPNPHRWRINHFDPRSGGLAFPLLQAAVNGAAGLPSYHTYIPTLAAVFALAVPGFWLLMRSVLPGPAGSTAARAALWGAGALAFNGAGAFVVFLGFGQQAAAAVLLAPLIAAAWRAAPGGGGRGALVAGGLLLAALMVTYSPALPLAGLALAGAGAGEALRSRSFWPALRILTVAVVAAALVPYAVVRLAVRAGYLAGDGGVGGLTSGPGVERFPPLAWGLGLLPGPGVALGWEVPLALPWMNPALSIALVALAGFLALAGALWMWRQRAFGPLGALLGAGALLAALRAVTPYPYGYFKLLPSAAPLLLLLPAVGFAALSQPLPACRRLRRNLRPVLRAAGVNLAAITGAVMVVNGGAAAYTARQNSPHEYGEAAALSALIAPGERVCILGGRGLEGPAAGAAANFLWHADLFGDFQTGYSTFFRPSPSGPANGACDWRLLPAQAPAPPVVAVPAPVWQGLGWRLLRRNPVVAAELDLAVLDAAPHAERTTGPGGAARLPINAWRSDGGPALEYWSPPLMGVLTPMWGARWRWPELTEAGVTMQITPAGDDLALVGPRVAASPGSGGNLSLALVVAADEGGALLEATAAGGARTVRVLSGAAVVSIGEVGPGDTVTVRTREGAVRLIATYLLREPRPGLTVSPLPGTLPLAADGRAEGGRAALTLRGPTGGAEAVLDIYREDGAVHYGYWQLGTGALPGEVTLDLAGQTLSVPGRAEPPHQVFPAPDGRYRGHLMLYRNGAPERSLTLFSFQLRNGAASDFVMEARGDRLW